ncbi:MAG: ABC transporter substrate-binding protein [Defluviitaleaceae bacterium]|nr:ABC transporter substrate-binding protein [Defluviitaleaceae bacterium]
MKRKFLAIIATLVLALVITACATDTTPDAPAQVTGGDETPAAIPPAEDGSLTAVQDALDEETIMESPLAALDAVLAQFPTEVTGNLPHVGNTLLWAIGSNTTFSGVLDPLFTVTAMDSGAADFVHGGGLIAATPQLTFAQDGIASVEFNIDEMTLTLTMQRDVYWHDGVPLTLNDLVFAYEVIAHPDYTGVRFGANINRVVGVPEYRDGEVDYISGLVLSDDHRQLVIHFTEFPQSIEHFDLWSTPAPRHHLEHIPITEMPTHDNVRHNILGFGPFVVADYVPGESFLFRRNENFHLGVPYIEYIVYEIIPPMSIPNAAQEGLFDILPGFPQSQFPYFQNPTNFTYMANPDINGFSHLTFNLGLGFDRENMRVIPNPDARMGDVNLRRAIAHSIPQLEIGQELFSGLVFPAGSILSPRHRPFMDPEVPFFHFDPELSMQILDDAGFIDIDGDGWREFPNGEQLEITLLWNNPQSPAAEANLLYVIQSIQDIGLNLVLFQGTTHDFQVTSDWLADDGPYEFDIMSGGWSTGWNPNPSGIFGPDSAFNRARFTNDTFDDIFNRFNSTEMWDPAFRDQVFSDYQWAMFNYIPTFPTTWAVGLTAVNNRVQNYSFVRRGVGEMGNWALHLIQLTAEEPYR